MYRRTGLRVDPYFSAPKMMWLREERPEIYAAAEKLIGVQDYVVYLLTGAYVTDWSQACRTMLMNISSFTWDKEMLRISGISRVEAAGASFRLVRPRVPWSGAMAKRHRNDGGDSGDRLRRRSAVRGAGFEYSSSRLCRGQYRHWIVRHCVLGSPAVR